MLTGCDVNLDRRDELAERLINLLGDPARAQSMGKKAMRAGQIIYANHNLRLALSDIGKSFHCNSKVDTEHNHGCKHHEKIICRHGYRARSIKQSPMVDR